MLTLIQQPEKDRNIVKPSGSIEALRSILTQEQQKPISYSEAEEVGQTLIEFYRVLAEEMSDEP